jgi:hypothetical protein
MDTTNTFLEFTNARFGEILPGTVGHSRLLVDVIFSAYRTSPALSFLKGTIRNEIIRDPDIMDERHECLWVMGLSGPWVKSIVTVSVGENRSTSVTVDRLDFTKHTVNVKRRP